MSSALGTHGTHAPGKTQGTDSSVSKYMSFLINQRTYAVALSHVAEITPYVELNQMPHTPDCVEGLLDLRGHVLPVVSLRTKMGLPKKERHESDIILILTHNDSRIGVLVDQIESVITASEEQQAPVSPLLEGTDGVWVQEIVLLNGKVVLVLEPSSLVRISQADAPPEQLDDKLDDIEHLLDDGLRKLIAMASDSRGDVKIAPQIENTIAHSESEMTKVLDRVEAMLASTDTAFSGIARFKQEVAIGGLKGYDSGLTELDGVTQKVQDNVFELIQQLQFQDIVRQRLERVLRHIMGMHGVISNGLN